MEQPVNDDDPNNYKLDLHGHLVLSVSSDGVLHVQQHGPEHEVAGSSEDIVVLKPGESVVIRHYR